MEKKQKTGLPKGFNLITRYVFPIIFIGVSGLSLWRGQRWMSGYFFALAVMMFINKFIQEIFNKKLKKDTEKMTLVMERRVQEMVASAMNDRLGGRR